MKTTENSLLLKGDQKPTLSATVKPVGARSVRPMKSMVRLKSIRPQKVELNKRLRRKAFKL